MGISRDWRESIGLQGNEVISGELETVSADVRRSHEEEEVGWTCHGIDGHGSGQLAGPRPITAIAICSAVV